MLLVPLVPAQLSATLTSKIRNSVQVLMPLVRSAGFRFTT